MLFLAKVLILKMLNRTEQYKVVINHEEQYSIVPISQSLSRGMREVGKVGSAKECLNFIEEVWTDMSAAEKLKLQRSIGL